MKSAISIGCALTLLASAAAHTSGINSINGGMPNRISMNVTVAKQSKQTQGATFGEKVHAGLQAAGSAVAQGTSLSIRIECGSAACVLMLPQGDGYRADLERRRVEVLKSNKTGDPGAYAARGGIIQGASLLGGALPGGSILSAAVSSVGTLAGSGGGAAAASYAASGRKLEGGKQGLATATRAPGEIDVLDPLADGDYTLTLVVEKATSGLKDTLKTQVRTAAPQRLEITFVFAVQGGALKTRHDIALNSIRNLK
jgi:hypothetical protein